MLRKISLAVAISAFFALMSTAALAQSADLTAADIDFFIEMANTPVAEQGQLMVDKGVDPQVYSTALTKITMWATVQAQPLDDATKTTMLTSNPSITFSQADLDLLTSRAADVSAAYTAITTPK